MMAWSRETRGSAMTRSLSTFRPTVKGVWSRLRLRCSLPCTNTRIGNTPELDGGDGSVMLWKAMWRRRRSLRYQNNDRIGRRREGAEHLLSPPVSGSLRPFLERRLTGSSGPATESGNRLLLTVVNLKNRNQFGNRQRVAQALAESGQFDVGPARARRRVDADKGSEATAVDVVYSGKIQHNLPGGTQQVLESFP